MWKAECVLRYLDTTAKGAIGENTKPAFFILPSRISNTMMTTPIDRFSCVSRIQWCWMAFNGDLEQKQNPLKCFFLQTWEWNMQWLSDNHWLTLVDLEQKGPWNKDRNLLFIFSALWVHRLTLVWKKGELKSHSLYFQSNCTSKMEMLGEWCRYLHLGITTITDALRYPKCLSEVDGYDTLECLLWHLDTCLGT